MGRKKQWMELNRKSSPLPIILIDIAAYGLHTYFAQYHDGHTHITHYRQAYGGRGFTEDVFGRYVRMYQRHQSRIIPWMRRWLREFDRWLVFARRLSRMPVQTLSPTSMIVLLERYYDMGGRAVNFAYDYRICGQFLPQQVQSILLKRVGNARVANQCLSDILHLSQPIDMHKEQMALRRMAIRTIQHPSAVDRLLAQHAKRYGYLGMYTFFGTPHGSGYYRQTLRRLQRKGVRKLQQEIMEMRSRFTHNRALVRRMFKQYPFTTAERTSIEQLRFLNDVSMICDEQYSQLGALTFPLLQEIARRYRLSYNQIIQLSVPELIGVLRGKQSPNRLALVANQRNVDHALIMEGGSVRIIAGPALKRYSRGYRAQLKKIQSQKVIHGETAYPGMVRGIATIIRDIADIQKFKKGHILVAGATIPQYVPALRKAVAIVTDEGGMLSHAAIMSREFQKPCVIGTQVATRALKNGMRIEVDADRGIIKKL